MSARCFGIVIGLCRALSFADIFGTDDVVAVFRIDDTLGAGGAFVASADTRLLEFRSAPDSVVAHFVNDGRCPG